MPKRIQLKRTRGWRKPEGAVVVARPSKWGNPYQVGAVDEVTGKTITPDLAVKLYEGFVCQTAFEGVFQFSELRGKDLCCWCPLDQPCHADVLLELANEEEEP